MWTGPFPQLPLPRPHLCVWRTRRFLEACRPGVAKPQLPGGFTQLGSTATYRRLPAKPSPPSPNSSTEQQAEEADVAVLLLTMTQLPETRAALGPDPPNPNGAAVGGGKAQPHVALMAAEVALWTDRDSLAAWGIGPEEAGREGEAAAARAVVARRLQLQGGAREAEAEAGEVAGGEAPLSPAQLESLLQQVVRQLAQAAGGQQQQGAGPGGGSPGGGGVIPPAARGVSSEAAPPPPSPPHIVAAAPGQAPPRS